MAIRPYRIDPTERLDYALDWTRWLADGETLVASSWVPDTAALTPEDDTFTTTTTHVWLSAPGAGPGDRLRISNAVTSSAGRAGVQSLRFEVAVTWPPSLLEVPRVPAMTARVPASAVTASGNAVLAGVASVASAMSVPASMLAPSPLTLAGVAPVVVTVGVPASDVVVSVGEVPMDVVVNFSAGTPGTLLDDTALNAGTHGANWGAWFEVTTITHSVITAHPVVFPGVIRCGGIGYTGAEGQGLTFDFADAPATHDVFQIQFLSPITDVVGIYLIQFSTVPDSDYSNDTFDFEGFNFCVPQFHQLFTGPKSLRMHANGALGRDVSVGTQWLIVSFCHDGSAQTGELFVQDAMSLEVLGASRVTMSPAMGPLNLVQFQSYLRYLHAGTGSIQIKLFAWRTDKTWPPYAMTVPAPDTIVGTQSGPNTITLTWNSVCQIFSIERDVNGAGWAVLNSGFDSTGARTFSDATVSAGQSVQYRLTALVGSQLSAADVSNTMVVT